MIFIDWYEPPTTACDPLHASVILSCNFDTDFTDASPVGRVLTADGGASISGASPKFGAGALLIGAFGDTLTSPYSSDLLLPGGDYTIRCWVKSTTVSGVIAYVGNDNGGDPAWKLWMIAGGVAQFQWFYNAGANTATVTGTTPITDGAWHHIEVTRASDVHRIFVDGVLEGAPTTSAVTIEAETTTPRLSIGSYPGGFNPLIGRVDDIEFTVGHARHTASFPVPTKPNAQIAC